MNFNLKQFRNFIFGNFKFEKQGRFCWQKRKGADKIAKNIYAFARDLSEKIYAYIKICYRRKVNSIRILKETCGVEHNDMFESGSTVSY
jgi:hypothetical protein